MMLKKVLSLLIVLMLLMATAGPAVAVGDDVHEESGGGSGEGDPGGGDTSPSREDELHIFLMMTLSNLHYVYTNSLISPWNSMVIEPRRSFDSNIRAPVHEVRIDASNATGDK